MILYRRGSLKSELQFMGQHIKIILSPSERSNVQGVAWVVLLCYTLFMEACYYRPVEGVLNTIITREQQKADDPTHACGSG